MKEKIERQDMKEKIWKEWAMYSNFEKKTKTKKHKNFDIHLLVSGIS